MQGEILKSFDNDAGDERVLIVQRSDGLWTWRKQALHVDGWGSEGPDCGVYDSAESAENEARARTHWLAPLFH